MLTITLNKHLKEKYTASHHPPNNLYLGFLELNGHLKKKIICSNSLGKMGEKSPI